MYCWFSSYGEIDSMASLLVINPGSTSKRYALYKDRTVVLNHHFEQTATGFEVCTHTGNGVQECSSITTEAFQMALERVAKDVTQYLETQNTHLDAIALRLVAPGSEFQHHQEVDSTFVGMLRRKEMTAPLHIPHTLHEIQYVQQLFPKAKLIAVSDSAFHSTLPTRARAYSIDRSDAEAYDIYRFGYHGLSIASIVRRVHPVTGDNPKRLIVCHVGGGVSVTAVKDGKSIETTMGYSPASGLPMGSRAGDIDAGGLLQLMRAKNLKPSEAEVYINTKGGLYGLSETSDIRYLLDRRAKGDAIATETLDLFVYHIQQAIAASTVALGGVDMIVLTGTACSRSSEFRMMLMNGLTHLGVEGDDNRNDSLVGKDGICSTQKSNVKVVTIRTDEMGEMAQAAESVLLSRKAS